MAFTVVYPLAAYNFGAQTYHRNQVYAHHYSELIDIEKELGVASISKSLLQDLDRRLSRIENALRDDVVIRTDTKAKHFGVLLDVAELRTKVDRLQRDT